MTRWRRVLGLAAGVAIAALVLSEPVAAAGYDSSTEELIQGLNRLLTYIAVPIAIAVEAILIYTAVRFRNNDDPKPTEERRWLEITWTAATALILLGVGVLSYQVMAHPDVTTTPQQVAEVEGAQPDVVVVGHQWYWEVRYPGQNVSIQSAGTFYLPAGEDLTIAITSGDVIHSVHVPELALKQDAMPGQRTYVRTTITSTGEYQLYCAEFCGTAHSRMTATIKVTDESTYRDWLETQRESDS